MRRAPWLCDVRRRSSRATARAGHGVTGLPPECLVSDRACDHPGTPALPPLPPDLRSGAAQQPHLQRPTFAHSSGLPEMFRAGTFRYQFGRILLSTEADAAGPSMWVRGQRGRALERTPVVTHRDDGRGAALRPAVSYMASSVAISSRSMAPRRQKMSRASAVRAVASAHGTIAGIELVPRSSRRARRRTVSAQIGRAFEEDHRIRRRKAWLLQAHGSSAGAGMSRSIWRMRPPAALRGGEGLPRGRDPASTPSCRPGSDRTTGSRRSARHRAAHGGGGDVAAVDLLIRRFPGSPRAILP